MTHEFEQLIRRVHDDLYAASAIKTPEALQAEVAKLVMVLTGSHIGLVPPGPALHGLTVDWVLESYETLRKHRPAWDWGPIELDGASIERSVGLLERIDYADTERDFLGDALEVMRSIDAKRLGGQFFTDQRVTNLTLDLIEFDPEQHDFLDACAGTGGFLIPAAKRASTVANAKQILGIEIDEKISRLANVTLHHLTGSATDVVFNADSLRPPGDWPIDARRKVVPGTHSRLASNPPFGSKIKIRDPRLLSEYALARRWSNSGGSWIKTRALSDRPPEILFVERNLQFAEPGVGRVGLVLPYQILSGPQLGYLRHWLLTEARVMGVVDLPADTFQPWTGTKTCVIVFERRETPIESPRDTEDYPIFMSLARDIGHDRRGNPVRNIDGTIREDLTAVSRAYAAFRASDAPSTQHPGSFVVSARDVAGDPELRLNAAFHRPAARTLKTRIAALDDVSFDTRPVRDLVERIFYPGRFKREYVPTGGVPFLGGSNISQFSLTTAKALSTEDPHLSELLVREGWILVTRSGSTGIVSRVPAAWDGYAMSEHVIRIVPKGDDGIFANYLEAYLRSAWGQDLLRAGVFGSVIDEITPEYIADMLVPVPRDQAALWAVAESVRVVNEARDAVAQGLDEAQRNLQQTLASALTSRETSH